MLFELLENTGLKHIKCLPVMVEVSMCEHTKEFDVIGG